MGLLKILLQRNEKYIHKPNTKTRNKAILLPKFDKRVSEKNNHIAAIKTFN